MMNIVEGADQPPSYEAAAAANNDEPQTLPPPPPSQYRNNNTINISSPEDHFLSHQYGAHPDAHGGCFHPMAVSSTVSPPGYGYVSVPSLHPAAAGPGAFSWYGATRNGDEEEEGESNAAVSLSVMAHFHQPNPEAAVIPSTADDFSTTAAVNPSLQQSTTTKQRSRHEKGYSTTLYGGYKGLSGVSFMPFPTDAELFHMSQSATIPDPTIFQQGVYNGRFVKAMLSQLPTQVQLSPEKLAWILLALSGVDTVHISTPSTRIHQNQPRVSFKIIFFESIEAFQQAQAAMERRVLVDRNGVWFALDDVQLIKMQEYMANSRPRHAPKSTVTLAYKEEVAVRRRQHVTTFSRV